MKNKYDEQVFDKERRVLELRRAGVTFDVIAQEVGYSNASGAHHAYTRALKRTLQNAGADEMREVELDRLDRLQRFAWTAAAQGNLRAIETILRIMGRRAKMLGLDMPVKVEQEVTVWSGDSSIDREVQRLIAQLDSYRGSEGGLADSLGEDGAVTADD